MSSSNITEYVTEYVSKIYSNMYKKELVKCCHTYDTREHSLTVRIIINN